MRAGVVRKVALGVAVLLASAWVMLAVMRSNDLANTEWNPLIRDPAELAGTWEEARSKLILEGDGRYACRGPVCQSIGTEGRWARESDFYVTFTSTQGGRVYRRLALRHGTITLVEGADARDPDEWNPRFTFAKSGG